MRRERTGGQSLTELALCLAMVVAVILAMRLYIQRSLQARYKRGVDYLFSEIKKNAADQGIANFSNIKQQYDPYYRESKIIRSTGDPSTGKPSTVTVGFPETSIDQITAVKNGSWERVLPAQDAD